MAVRIDPLRSVHGCVGFMKVPALLLPFSLKHSSYPHSLLVFVPSGLESSLTAVMCVFDTCVWLDKLSALHSASILMFGGSYAVAGSFCRTSPPEP